LELDRLSFTILVKELQIKPEGIKFLFGGFIKSTTVKQKEETLDALEDCIAKND
jgi:hypothetical protein